jgi:hypothetical protein
MSISSDIMKELSDVVSTIVVNKSGNLNGETATEVTVNLLDGKQVIGTFANHPRSSFGGVDFAGPKDIPGLMISKIRSVLEGTYE